MHHRLQPVVHRFAYPAYVYAFEVSELEQLSRQLRWFGYNRAGLVSLHSRDYLDGSQRPLLEKLHEVLRAHGNQTRCSRVVLVTGARFLGYIFNPVSFWFCRDRTGAVRAVLCAVNNTFGENHCYLVHHADYRPLRPDEWLDGRKVFHVSPFLPVDGTYRFRFRLDDRHAHVDVNYHDAQGLMLA
ncbi:MAG: DUF1365 domain-containing protein, partial [Candidatus Eremiobacteraeota bacterium]|nr:DUF1365 domain-containing protein [Candidatus Eremiobacteraeota bacterium]